MRWVLCLVLAMSFGCGGDDSQPRRDGGLTDGGGGAADEGSADAGPATLSGEVVDRSGAAPVPVEAAAVSLAGRSGGQTTAADGLYSFTLPVGQEVFLRAEKATYFPKELGVIVPAGGAMRELELVPRASVARTATALSATLDPAKGIVIVRFAGTATDGGYGATLSAGHDPPFTFGVGAAPTVSPTLLMNGGRNLLFFNVTAGTTMVGLTAPAGKTCVTHEAITRYRVDADTILDLDVDCN